MKIIKIHNKKLKLKEVKRLASLDYIKFVTRPDDPYISEAFRKIKKLAKLNYNFIVYTTKGSACIHIKNGKIYFDFSDINSNDCNKLISYVDKHRIKIENYNTNKKISFENFILHDFISKLIDDMKNNV